MAPGSGRPIEPGFTAMSTAPRLPIGRPNSLEPYWSITVTPQCSRKKRTTSAFRGSPQLLAARRRTFPATASAPSAITARSSVGVVARLLTRRSRSAATQSSGVGAASSESTGTPRASAPM